jgi:predicted metal-dependent peptidase
MENTTNQLISDALIVLIQSPLKFVKAIGYRLAAMPRVATMTLTKTMAVDGVTLFYNPEWTARQSKIKILFVLLHEGCHVWMLHPKRLRDIYPHLRDLVHQAADFVVNLTLEQANCPYPVPEDALINRSFVDHQGRCLNVERVVEILMQQPQQPEPGENGEGDDDTGADGDETDDSEAGGNYGGSDDSDDTDENGTDSAADNDSGDDSADGAAQSSGADDQDTDGGDSGTDSDSDSGSGDGLEDSSQSNGCNDSTPDSCGDLLPAPDDLDEDEHVKRNEQALQLASQGAGHMPDNMLEELHKQAQGSDTDWLTMLKDRFATAVDASDWSEEKFNQQYAMIGMIEPTLYTESVGSIAIVVDESSSMDNDALNKATEQIAAIVAEWTPQRVLILRHTTQIVDEQELVYGQEPEPRDKRAHGGTYFNPVIQRLEDEMVEVACWVTDCYPCDTPRDTSIPIIWLGTEYGSENAHASYNLQGDFIAIGDL